MQPEILSLLAQTVMIWVLGVRADATGTSRTIACRIELGARPPAWFPDHCTLPTLTSLGPARGSPPSSVHLRWVLELRTFYAFPGAPSHPTPALEEEPVASQDACAQAGPYCSPETKDLPLFTQAPQRAVAILGTQALCPAQSWLVSEAVETSLYLSTWI